VCETLSKLVNAYKTAFRRTRGAANPTLTLAALALRTADVLRRNLNQLPVV
jgi:hypothetical protein